LALTRAPENVGYQDTSFEALHTQRDWPY